MKKILFLQSQFDFNQFYDSEVFLNSDKIEFLGINYLNKKPEFFLKFDEIYNCDYSDIHSTLIVKKAKSIGIKTFLLMDGIYDWANSYLNPKWVDENSKFDLSIYNLVYCVENHTKSFLKLHGIETKIYKPPRIFRVSEKKTKFKKNNKASKNRILITTSNTPYFNNIEFERIIKIFKGIIKWCGDNSIEIFYRIYDKKILDRLDINKKINLTKGSIDLYLDEIDILITTPSSVSVTSAMYDKPFIHVIYRDTPNTLQAAWQIFDVEMVPDVIKSALNRDKYRMLHQRTIIPKKDIKNFDNLEYMKSDFENFPKINTLKYTKVVIKNKLKFLYHKFFKYK